MQDLFKIGDRGKFGLLFCMEDNEMMIEESLCPETFTTPGTMR
ncbi:hypothetical protein JMA_29040 [Jeotgalibacillus malaysiensis]|uniref:Uncharacterized protein n=1 Tax=Jeotgalibacillus malaysiensis TaxID=1508404 RepID=A0A0B5AQ36_9BACL|nr:hypothetical protein JMA_29040 [Jeotgalibacillus malaysiensis]